MRVNRTGALQPQGTLILGKLWLVSPAVCPLKYFAPKGERTKAKKETQTGCGRKKSHWDYLDYFAPKDGETKVKKVTRIGCSSVVVFDKCHWAFAFKARN